MNIPTYEGENPRINTGSCRIINDSNNATETSNLNCKGISDEIASKDADIVSEDGIKVYNQNVVLCDAVKRNDPHVSLINDVTPELLSRDRRGSETIVTIMQDCDKKVQR